MTASRIRQVTGWFAVLAFAATLAVLVYGWQTRRLGPFKACVHACHDGDCCDGDYPDTAHDWFAWLPLATAVLGVASVVVRARTPKAR